MSYPTLFSPFRIAGVALRNRVVFQPHFTALGTSAGMPSDDHVAYHEERARGGAGLIVFESQAVHPLGKMAPRFVHAWDPAVVPAYRRITEAVHRNGAAIFGQLTHAGHTSLEHPPHVMWAPTQMPEPSSSFTTKAMVEGDIDALLDGFVAAACNAREGGFDGVEVKIAHDGLLRSFASPFFNRRTDRWGGSFEARMRLPVAALAAIKQAAGADFPVGVRICLDEDTPFGYGLDYGLQMAEHLEESGHVDYFNCDAGSFSSFWTEIPPAEMGTEYFRNLNQALKSRTALPVVAFGLINTGSEAERILTAGDADLIGFCRQLIADPETPLKLQGEDEAAVRRCIGCNDACTHQTSQDRPVRCIHNPAAGRERRFGRNTIGVTADPRNVTVVGGGPAGMKAAEVLAVRGHEVTLLEREQELGGLVRLAARQPHHGQVGEVVNYLAGAVERSGVTVELGIDADPDALLARGADLVVLAVGSAPTRPFAPAEAAAVAAGLQLPAPEVPGLDAGRCASVDEVLRGELPRRAGSTAVVVEYGAHRDAAGTAELLRAQGWDVVLATTRELVAAELNAISRSALIRRLAATGIRTVTGARLVDAAPRTAVFEDLLAGTRRAIDDVDLVVFAERRSRADLFLSLSAHAGAPPIERVGDCVAPRLIQSVLLEAEEFARAV